MPGLHNFCFAKLLSQREVLSPGVVMMCIVHLPTTQGFLYLNLLDEQGGKIDSSRDHWVHLCREQGGSNRVLKGEQ